MNAYVNNPSTGRLIKIGSRKWKELTNHNLLKTEALSDTTLMECSNVEEAKELQGNLKKGSLGKNKIVSRRGNKIISSNRRPTHTEIVNNISGLFVDIVNTNRNIFDV